MEGPRALLLIPSLPSSLNFTSMSAAYGPALSSTIQHVLRLDNKSSRAAVLQIAVPYPVPQEHAKRPRGHLFKILQSTLARVYKLICIICARDSVEIRGGEGIDAQVLFFNHAKSDLLPSDAPQGPIVDLFTLATSARQWTAIYTLANEEGNSLLDQYVSLADEGLNSTTTALPIHRVPSGADVRRPWPSSGGTSGLFGPEYQAEQERRHVTVAVGGTFDHLHAGHKLLLTMTMLLLEPLPHGEPATEKRRGIVGITGDEMLKKKRFAEYLDSWTERQNEVAAFVKSISCFTAAAGQSIEEREFLDGEGRRSVHTTFGHKLTLECVEIGDPFGPTITEEAITALVVSAETRGGGQAVNDKRQEKGWQQLAVYEVDVLDAHEREDQANSTGIGEETSFANKISSTELRRQEIERSKVGSL